MKNTILTITLVLSTTIAVAQVNENLQKFFSMLTVENLDSNGTKIVEIKGTVLTFVEYSSVVEQHTNCKVDFVNIPYEVRWTTKEEYDELYPEDKATNADSEFISMLFDSNVVERHRLFNETGTNVNGNTTIVEDGTGHYLNITFKTSALAAQAKEYFVAYIADQTD